MKVFLIWTLVCFLAFVASGLEIECGEAPPERRAAAELKKYVALLAEDAPDLKFRIGVKYLDKFPSDKAVLGDWDGYAVRRKDGFIYVISSQPRGCLYGVYDFLERNSDIIWARPDEECGTIYSRTKTFEAHEADFVEMPKFQMRGWWFTGSQRHEASEYWHARVRCNFGCANQKHADVLRRAVECGFFIGGAAGHNMPQFMPDEAYDIHPEYFAEIGGVRRRDKERTQLCFSNLLGAAVVGSNVVIKIAERLAEMKSAQGIAFDKWAVKQADNQRLCECVACKADIPLGNGRVSRKGDVNFRANQFFRYLNKVEEIVSKTYPDMRIDTFAYHFSAPPPDVRVDEMYNVAFCPFIKNDRFSVTNVVNAKWKVRAEKWSKATTNIMWREYWGCASGYPRQNSLVAADDLKWINSVLGFTRVYSEGPPDMDGRTAQGKGKDYRPLWDASAMERWVLSRLMWNPYVPVEQYREEYIRRTYRKAAAPMREFYALIAKTWFSSDRPSNWTDDPVGNASRYIVEAGIDKRIMELLDEAVRLAANDVSTVGKLLSRQRDHFWNLIRNAREPAEPLVVPLVKDGDWSKAAKIDEFLEVNKIRTKVKRRSSRKTKVFICHDMKNLKVRFVCSDPDTSKLESKANDVSGRESFPCGDHIEFCIMTQKGRHKYHFGVDSRGKSGDMRDGDSGFNAKWTSEARIAKRGYVVDLSIDFESIGAEITQESRFDVCFARMATPRTPDEERDFSSWKGDHPKCEHYVGSIFISME